MRGLFGVREAVSIRVDQIVGRDERDGAIDDLVAIAPSAVIGVGLERVGAEQDFLTVGEAVDTEFDTAWDSSDSSRPRP